MVTLTKAQQQQYIEELAHIENKQHAKDDAEYKREMEEQYEKQPPRRTKQTPYEKIKASVKKAASSVKSAGQTAYDAGAQARQTGQDIGNTPAVRSMRGQSGFINQPVQAAPRHASSRQQYPGAPVDQQSVMHPGNTTFIIKCTDGQCEMSRRQQRAPRPPRQQRSYATGLLGGNDPGL